MKSITAFGIAAAFIASVQATPAGYCIANDDQCCDSGDNAGLDRFVCTYTASIFLSESEEDFIDPEYGLWTLSPRECR